MRSESSLRWVSWLVGGLLLAPAGACGDGEAPGANMNADGLRHEQRLQLDSVVSFAADESTIAVSVGSNPYRGGHLERVFDFNTGEELVERGAIAVYEREGDLWGQTAFLTHLTPAEGYPELGRSLALDGNTILATNGNNIVIFEKVDSGWSTVDEIESACSPVLAIRGDIALSGGNCPPWNPSVEVFRRTVGGWAKVQELTASREVPGRFVTDIAFDGKTIVVGSNGGERVFVFEDKDGAFEETQVLERVPDSDPYGFGLEVEVSGDRIAVTAPGTERDGRVFIYERQGGAWVRTAMPDPLNFRDVIEWGSTIALRGSRLVVGAPFERTRQAGINQIPDPRRTTSSPQYGAAYLFEEANGEWEQRYYVKSARPERFEHFGSVVALTDNLVFIGRTGESGGHYVHVWTREESP
ncbi:MAG: hypothetical protein KJO40_10280 [Deltaproteobacteria bacterium]|nr:hypothetical protein [Deltaproteobacteria bacterium]NND26969.1 hypothetical protein [Myxococcales bacterium]MBT8467082.1 hypothetical protein [Deltaproteobacteria bacterium]MBT8481823.1 hypothetical protein [Deltaproteobacteria bacterium]NNK08243.1 hypothetical protein [Myxococcales bacterium]